MSDVTYSISLKDMLTAKLKEAELEAGKLDTKMEGLKTRIGGLGSFAKEALGAIGIGFAVFKGFQTIEEGVHKVHELHAAEAQLANTMQNAGTYSEEAFEKVIAGAKETSKSILFSTKDIVEMQSQIRMLGSVSEKDMGKMTAVSADLAAKYGMGLTEAGNMLAKAVNNPEMMRALSQKLKIDPAVAEHIKNLAKDGKEAEARMEILAIAEGKVGGAAKAAFDADPLAGFNKGMASMKLALGEAAIGLQSALAPALMYIAGAVKGVAAAIKGMISWVKQNKDIVQALAIGVGVAATIFGVYTVVTNTAAITTGVMTAAVWLLTTAQTALNFVMSINPFVAAAIAIGAMVAGIIIAWENCVGFRAVVMGLWGTIKEFGSIVTDVFLGVAKVIHGVFSFNASEITAGYSQAAGAMQDAGTRMATAYKKGHDDVMKEDAKNKAEEAKKKAEEEEKKKTIAPALGGGYAKPPASGTGDAGGATGSKKDTSPKGATGSKSVTINVSIGKLIETFKVQTSTMGEGVGKVREMVAQTLLSAVNDSQITAGI